MLNVERRNAEGIKKKMRGGPCVLAAMDGVPQDIEGVVKGGDIYVVQTRPQV